MHGLVDDFETESHVGARITIGYRENINTVNVFPTLEKALNGGGQSVHHAGRVNVGNGLGQSYKPANNGLIIREHAWHGSTSHGNRRFPCRVE
jgi:hypothetical protein